MNFFFTMSPNLKLKRKTNWGREEARVRDFFY